MTVAILGASENPSRYAFRAFQDLRAHHHEVFLVNPKLTDVQGVPVVAQLADLEESVDTVTMYVSPAISTELEKDLVTLKPRRVIFNPGSENDVLEKQLRAAGIRVVRACTLVLLATGQFESAN